MDRMAYTAAAPGGPLSRANGHPSNFRSGATAAGAACVRPRLVMLPGLGADARQFRPQREHLPDLQTPPWLDPRPDEALADYGRRMAEHIPTRPPYLLGGVSFGGMVALEAARHLHPPPLGIILVASCRGGRCVRALFRRPAVLMPLLPPRLAKLLFAAVPLTIAAAEGLSRRERRAMRAMYADTPAPLLRWAAAAIARWPGPVDLPAPVYHVHGDRDPVIPLRNVAPDAVVRGAGHALNATHAAELDRLLAGRIEQWCVRPE